VAQILIDRDRCKGCGHCITACPQQILAASGRINAKGYAPAEVAEPKRCLGCRLCCIACPDLAIEMAVAGTLYRYFAY
jgi:2-oxoglutarate ferredoxin oxidoreductase subunit delta